MKFRRDDSFGIVTHPMVAAMLVLGCTACMAFLGPDNDPARAHPQNVIDKVIYDHGLEGADKISRIIKDEFENYNPGARTPNELRAYFEKFGSQCEVRAEIVCTHQGYFAAYIYKFFFDIPLGRRLDTRVDYVVRVSFPEDGADVIAKMTVETEKTIVKWP